MNRPANEPPSERSTVHFGLLCFWLAVFLAWGVRVADLPAVVVDADADAHAGSPESDAGPGAIVPIAIAAALDVALARRIITIGIANDHAAAAAGAVASAVVVTDQSNLLHQFRARVLAGGDDVRSLCVACDQRAGSGQKHQGEFSHKFLLNDASALRKEAFELPFVPGNRGHLRSAIGTNRLHDRSEHHQRIDILR